MLNTLTINNYTLIDAVEIELTANMNVLTGETGAGKSILIDAIALVMGGRAEKITPKNPEQPCELFASFDLRARPDIQSWLQQHELTQTDECILRRVFNKDGRSRCYINGKPSPLQQVRELGYQLLNIHGQHEQQFLQKPEHQRLLLDQYADHLKLVHHVKQCFHEWEELNAQIGLLSQQDQERIQRLEFLRFQAQELTQLNVSHAELKQLEQDQKRLAHVEELGQFCHQAIQICESSSHATGILSELNQLQILLSKITQVEEKLTPAREGIEAAQIHLQEAFHDLQHYGEALNLDPNQLSQIDARLAEIHDLARKHRIPPQQLPELLNNIEQEIEQLAHHDDYLQQLTQQAQDALKQFQLAAKELSRKRRLAAKKLIPLVNENLKRLNMPHCLFDIRFNPLLNNQMASYGLENLEFLIRPNPGQPFNPIGKIASGGELSRISLSIQVVTAEKHATPTLIFDEVDTGVGGNSADMIGNLLRQLSDKTQVICITHLPQVAAKAQHHLLIHKQQDQQQTHTTVQTLTGAARIKEIARMVGGAKITTKTKAHAKELLEQDG